MCCFHSVEKPLPSCIRRMQVRLAMGTVHYELGEYPAALKMWRMAADATPLADTANRMAIMRNTGVALLRQQRYQVLSPTTCTTGELP